MSKLCKEALECEIGRFGYRSACDHQKTCALRMVCTIMERHHAESSKNKIKHMNELQKAHVKVGAYLDLSKSSLLELDSLMDYTSELLKALNSVELKELPEGSYDSITAAFNKWADYRELTRQVFEKAVPHAS